MSSGDKKWCRIEYKKNSIIELVEEYGRLMKEDVETGKAARIFNEIKARVTELAEEALE